MCGHTAKFFPCHPLTIQSILSLVWAHSTLKVVPGERQSSTADNKEVTTVGRICEKSQHLYFCNPIGVQHIILLIPSYIKMTTPQKPNYDIIILYKIILYISIQLCTVVSMQRHENAYELGRSWYSKERADIIASFILFASTTTESIYDGKISTFHIQNNHTSVK